jgi:hypothetical protein
LCEIRKFSSISRFEHESQKKVASLPSLGLDSGPRFSDLSFHSQPCLHHQLKSKIYFLQFSASPATRRYSPAASATPPNRRYSPANSASPRYSPPASPKYSPASSLARDDLYSLSDDQLQSAHLEEDDIRSRRCSSSEESDLPPPPTPTLAATPTTGRRRGHQQQQQHSRKPSLPSAVRGVDIIR